jgi:hypothetical protein
MFALKFQSSFSAAETPALQSPSLHIGSYGTISTILSLASKQGSNIRKPFFSMSRRMQRLNPDDPGRFGGNLS